MASDFDWFDKLWFGDSNDDEARHAAASSVAVAKMRVLGLRPFPHAAQELIGLSRRADVTAMDMEKVIQTDPGLTVRLLETVNSAAYGFPSRATSVSQAAVLLGFRRVQEIATSMLIMEAFEDNTQLGKSVLEHSVAVAALAQRIAMSCRSLSDAPAYTCGLLHDLGKLMILQSGDAAYAVAFATCTDPENLYVRERELFGYDHATLAATLMEEWGMPEQLSLVVGWHHQPGRAYADGIDPVVAGLVACVRLADKIAHRYAASDSDAAAVDEFVQNEAASFLGLSQADVEEILGEVHTVMCQSRTAA